MDFHSHINQTIIWQITIYHTWESYRVLRIQWYPDTSNPKVRTKFVKTKVKLEKNVKVWAVELGRNLWSLWMPVVASEHSTELWCLFWFCSIFSCNAICSLPKLCKSSFHHCCSVVVVLGWHIRPPSSPGFKAQSMAGKIPAVSGGRVVFFLVPLLKGVVLLRGATFWLFVHDGMLHLHLQHYRTCDIFSSGIRIKWTCL